MDIDTIEPSQAFPDYCERAPWNGFFVLKTSPNRRYKHYSASAKNFSCDPLIPDCLEFTGETAVSCSYDSYYTFYYRDENGQEKFAGKTKFRIELSKTNH